MRIYVLLVKNHMRTCDPTNKQVPLVPEAYREAPIAALKEEGLDASGYAINF